MKKNESVQNVLYQHTGALLLSWLLLLLLNLLALLYSVSLWADSGFSVQEWSMGEKQMAVQNIVFLLLLLILFGLYRKFIWQRQRMLYQEQLKQKLEQERAYQQLLQKKITETERAQKEYRAQLQAMAQQSWSIQPEDCNKETIAAMQRLTGHWLLDALFSQKLQQALAKNVELQFDYQPNIQISHITETDLCMILGNLLENAIAAAADSDQRQVRCCLHRKNPYMNLICITNSCDNAPGFAEGLPKRLQEQEAAHGYGVKIVQRKVHQYKGNCLFRYDEAEKQFTASILLPCETD